MRGGFRQMCIPVPKENQFGIGKPRTPGGCGAGRQRQRGGFLKDLNGSLRRVGEAGRQRLTERAMRA
ncbi:hypothetical protein CEB3_c20170 [Peptococcaceae bacterium CEB3]|nr:hypothetical protein CEB3_c20170 [Peptococcaceae bacterium CEB3]